MLGISWLLSIVAATWLLLGCSTNAKVFKRIETGCKQNNVECLGVDTYTYCLNRSAGSYLLKFVFNCPKNYVCDETARYPCVRDTSSISTPISDQITSSQNTLPPKTDSAFFNKIIEDFVASLPLGTDVSDFENDIIARVPTSKISADDAIVSPTTSTSTEDEDDDSVIITPTDSSSPGGGSVIITPDGTTSSPSGSVIITPAPGSSAGGVIITPDASTSAPPSSPGGSGSVIITPETTVSPPSGSIIITPGSTSPPGNIIITGNSVLTGPVYFLQLNQESGVNSDVVEAVEELEPEIDAAGIIITPVTTAAPPVGGGGGGVIITPSTTVTPPPGGGGGIIITPNTTVTVPDGHLGDPPNCTTTGNFCGPTTTQYYECILVWWWYEFRLRNCTTGEYFNYGIQNCTNTAASDC